MATKEQLEEVLNALMPLLEQLEEFNRTYGDVLKEYRAEPGVMTEEDRADAAVKLIRKYSNL